MSDMYRLIACRKGGRRRPICSSAWVSTELEAKAFQQQLSVDQAECDFSVETSPVAYYHVTWSDSNARTHFEELLALPTRDVLGALRSYILAKIGHANFRIYRSYLAGEAAC